MKNYFQLKVKVHLCPAHAHTPLNPLVADVH